ncbi:MAG: CYTH domain-containing protein [Planctomycetes bacterium]|nr:CYTH domain-containing protein [Planctomycetota bacterium]NOG53732.1 class IV adenylate cyclase [Planctomycetota bacterium]
MQNIEVKCELLDIQAAAVQCEALGAVLRGHLEQVDTYYRLPDGRLKKRETKGRPPEWIFYHRPDRVTPRMSHFIIYSDDQAVTRWGSMSLREWLVVKKKRTLYQLDNVRIHLDQVDQLGHFIEFEALVSTEYPIRLCHQRIAELRTEFQPILGEAVAGSYSDLLDRHETFQSDV